MKRLIRKKQPPTYYKTECLDCELILRVKWERTYFGGFPRRSRNRRQLKVCPFCQSIRLKTVSINEQEYLTINQDWDMIDLATDPDENK